MPLMTDQHDNYKGLRHKWGTKDETGYVWPSRSKREAVAMANWPGRRLVRSTWTGPDLGWSEWEMI